MVGLSAAVEPDPNSEVLVDKIAEMSACALRASEQVLQAQQLQATIVVITVLINLAASWAAVHSDDLSKPVVEILFRELTVLGCIALLVLMSVKTGMPEEISTQVSPCVCISTLSLHSALHSTAAGSPCHALANTRRQSSKKRVRCEPCEWLRTPSGSRTHATQCGVIVLEECGNTGHLP